MATEKIFQKADMLALSVEAKGGRKCNMCYYTYKGSVEAFGRHYRTQHKEEYKTHMEAKKLTLLYV